VRVARCALAARVILFALVCVASPVRAQTAARISAAGHVVTITNDRTRHRITLPDSVRVDMDTVEVLDSQHILSTSYLLLVVKGPSKRAALGAGQCGAGSETAIVWLQLLSWRIQRVQSQLVESCWENSFITGTIEWIADQLRMTYSDAAAGATRRVLRYDRLNPDRGFTVAADSSVK
jgi:hypothetical protein